MPQNVEVDIQSEKSILEIALSKGLHIQSSCKGGASCGECRVYLLEGENHVLPPTPAELSIIGQGYFIDRRRLSCQLYCFGDVVVDLKEQGGKSKISKNFLKRVKKEKESEVHSSSENLIEEDMKKS